MPRKSAAATLIKTPARVTTKLDVPYDLSEREGAVWRAVTGALPDDYFSSAQVPQLKTYCRAVVECENVHADLEAERAKKRPRAKEVAKLRLEWKGWMETENRLARSMRLTHQAVTHHKTAGAQHTRGKAQQASEALAELNDEDAFTDA